MVDNQLTMEDIEEAMELVREEYPERIIFEDVQFGGKNLFFEY